MAERVNIYQQKESCKVIEVERSNSNITENINICAIKTKNEEGGEQVLCAIISNRVGIVIPGTPRDRNNMARKTLRKQQQVWRHPGLLTVTAFSQTVWSMSLAVAFPYAWLLLAASAALRMAFGRDQQMNAVRASQARLVIDELVACNLQNPAAS